MLDLKKMERALDKALAKETPRSLRKWLAQNRNKHKRLRIIKLMNSKTTP